MIPAEFLELIDTSYNEEEKQVLVSCLFQDKRVLDALALICERGEIHNDRLKKIENWKPAYFGLILHTPTYSDRNLSDIIKELSKKNSNSKGLESEFVSKEESINLEQASEAALYLFELLKTREWGEIENEYLCNHVFNRDAGIIAGCLLGLFDSPIEMLKEISENRGNIEIRKMFCYGLFCNPYPISEQENYLKELCNGLHDEERVELFQFIIGLGHSKILEGLIQKESHVNAEKRNENKHTFEAELTQLRKLNHSADINYLAGANDKSIEYLESLIQKIDEIRDSAQEKLKNYSSLEPSTEINGVSIANSDVHGFDWRSKPVQRKTIEFVKPALHDLDTYLQQIEELIPFYPGDAHFHQKIARFYQSMGDKGRTENHLRIAQMLDKTNIMLEQEIFNHYVTSRQWSKALKCIPSGDTNVKKIQPFEKIFLGIKELIATGEIEKAKQRLEGFPIDLHHDENEVLFKLGELFMDLKNWDKAIEIFNLAKLAGTNTQDVLIKLYCCQKKNNQKQAADEIRTQIIQNSTNEKTGLDQFVLALLENEEDDQGLILLDKISLEDGSPDAIAGIVEKLIEKGYENQAYEVALKAISYFPLHAELGMKAAYVLNEKGQKERVKEQLNWIKDEKRADTNYLIFKAITQLQCKTSEFPLDAKTIKVEELNQLTGELQSLPEDNYWRGLLEAEIQYLLGNITDAAEKFKKLILNNSIGQNRKELWRAQVGLAQTMLKTGQNETATALLNESLRMQPGKLAIYDLLIEAYQKLNLTEEIFSVIKKAHKENSTNKKLTSWYADQMLKIGKIKEVHAYFRDETNNNLSSPNFLVEKLKFEKTYGSIEDVERILTDILSLENLTEQELTFALEIAQEAQLSDICIKIIHKLKSTTDWDSSMIFLEACVRWNNDNHVDAINCLASIDGDGEGTKPWGLIRDAISEIENLNGQGNIPITKVAVQTIESMDIIEQKLNELPDMVKTFMPGEWKAAFSTKELWLKLALISALEGDEKLGDIPKLFDSQEPDKDDPIAILCMHICEWLMKGDVSKFDWISLLESLNDYNGGNERQALIGIILNILLEAGNEIAVAKQLNIEQTQQSKNREILLANARLIFRNGNSTEAQEYYQQACAIGSDQKIIFNSLDGRLVADLTNIPVWKATCAFELMKWEDAENGYIECLGQNKEFLFLQQKAREQLLRLGIDEWCYRSVGAVRNVPTILQNKKLEVVLDGIKNLPIEKQNQIQSIYSFLIDVTFLIPEQVSNCDEFPDVFLTLIHTCQKGDIETVNKLLENHLDEQELALSALALLSEDKYYPLISNVQGALYRDKQNPCLMAALAKIFIHENEHELAIDMLESALGILEDEPTWQAQLAQLYEEQGELRKSLEHSKQAVFLEPKDQGTIREHIKNLCTLNQYKEATSLYEKSPTSFVDKETLIKIADAYFQMDQYRKALNVIKQIDTGIENDLDLLLIQAKIATKLGSLPKAMELIRKAYRVDPKSPEVIIELATIKAKQENDEFGLEIIDKALESNIRDERLVVEKAKYLEITRGKKRAADFLAGFLEKTQSTQPLILNQYALIQMELGNNDDALTTFECSLRVDDIQPEIHLRAGELDKLKGNLDNAVYHLDKATKQDTTLTEAYLHLTDVFLKRREENRAEAIILSAIQNCEENYLIYESASKVYNLLGDIDQAETYLRKATALNPTDESLREKLGIILADRIFDK